MAKINGPRRRTLVGKVMKLLISTCSSDRAAAPRDGVPNAARQQQGRVHVAARRCRSEPARKPATVMFTKVTIKKPPRRSSMFVRPRASPRRRRQLADGVIPLREPTRVHLRSESSSIGKPRTTRRSRITIIRPRKKRSPAPSTASRRPAPWLRSATPRSILSRRTSRARK